MSGSDVERVGDRLASALSTPACICGIDTAACSTARSTCPDIISVIAGPGAAIRNDQHLGVGELLQEQRAELAGRILVDELGSFRMRLQPCHQIFQAIGEQIPCARPEAAD